MYKLLKFYAINTYIGPKWFAWLYSYLVNHQAEADAVIIGIFRSPYEWSKGVLGLPYKNAEMVLIVQTLDVFLNEKHLSRHAVSMYVVSLVHKHNSYLYTKLTVEFSIAVIHIQSGMCIDAYIVIAVLADNILYSYIAMYSSDQFPHFLLVNNHFSCE